MTAPLHIAFRADASVEIGSGHVMRCLTLADALAEAGARCHFICRDLPGQMVDYISTRGHAVTLLPAPTADQTERFLSAPPVPPHAAWAGVPLDDDIAQSRAVLAKLVPGRVVVDHYALDARWETQAPPRGTPVMVIDDLADRQHLSDILLDQNLGRQAEDYRGLVPPHCKLLIGPHYALLRPEFARLRETALARRQTGKIQNLLITLGGTDKDNATGAVLEAMSGIALPDNLKITVVMGKNAPKLDAVYAQAETMSRPTRILCGVSNMAELMTEADLCIGAAGSTSWERCALGLPTLLLVLADNQREAAKALSEIGVCVVIEFDDRPQLTASIEKFIAKLMRPEMHSYIVAQSSQIADGLGTNKVANFIFQQGQEYGK